MLDDCELLDVIDEPSPTRRAMEQQWRKRGVAESANLCVWYENHGGLTHKPGESREARLTLGLEAWLNKLRPRDYTFWGRYGAPHDGKVSCPDWLRARFKANCPRNYKALVAGYGRLDKGDHR